MPRHFGPVTTVAAARCHDVTGVTGLRRNTCKTRAASGVVFVTPVTNWRQTVRQQSGEKSKVA